MTKEQILEALEFLHEHKMINDWIFGTCLDKIEKLTFEEKKDFVEVRKQIEAVSNNQIGVGLGQKIKNSEIEKEHKEVLLKAITNGNIQAHNSEKKVDDNIDESKLQEAIKKLEEVNGEVKPLNDFEKNQLLYSLRNKIYGIIQNSDIPKYFHLKNFKLDTKTSQPILDIEFSKKEDRDINLINKYSSLSIAELKDNYSSLRVKWQKSNPNDKLQRNNYIMKTKELVEITRILSIKDPANKDNWVKERNTFENSLKMLGVK